jgi:luciferase family oxidoreductase group 1
LRLSVLDQSPVSAGATGAEALRNTLDLARLCDELGYLRYWVAEHHGTPMLACTTPEVLIAAAAAATSRIRVGSGGVMLPHYSPLKVAETFSTLAALHPGRIDLGVGRAAGTDPRTTWALQRDRRQPAPGDFPEQLAELLAWLDESLPVAHPFARIPPLPGRPERPRPWLLGSSRDSAAWAAEAGLPYAFADFINREGAPIAGSYRQRFTASPDQPRPYVMVAATAICAPTDDEAQRIASSARVVLRRLRQGVLAPVPSIDDALRLLRDEDRTPVTAVPARRGIVGDPPRVVAALEELAAEYEADEIMLLTITHEHAHRRRSYELLARAFD